MSEVKPNAKISDDEEEIKEDIRKDDEYEELPNFYKETLTPMRLQDIIDQNYIKVPLIVTLYFRVKNTFSYMNKY